MKGWKRLDGNALHFPERFPEVADALHVVDGREHCLAAMSRRRGRIHRHNVLGGAVHHIRAKHFVKHFVLAKIDVTVAERNQECAKGTEGGS